MTLSASRRGWLRALRKIAASANLKGFRKGKAPLELIREIYGADLRGEAMDALMREALVERLESEGLKPAEPPRAENMRPTSQEGVEVEFVFEVYPEIGAVDLKRIRLERLQPTVAEADVDRLLEELRLRHAEWSEVARPARATDRLEVVFDGTGIDSGKKHFDRREATLVLGRERLPCDLQRQLEGMAAGEHYEGDGLLAEDFPGLELIGERRLKLRLELNKVEEATPAPLDKAFFEKCGIETEDESALRARLREQLALRARDEAKRHLVNALFERLDEAHADLPLPAKMVADEARALTSGGDTDARSDEMREGEEGAAPQISEEVRAAAQKRVRLGLVIDQLTENFSIEVTQDEVRAAIEAMSAPYGEQAPQMAQIYLSNEEILRSLRLRLVQDRLVEQLLGEVTYEDKAVACEDLFQSLDAVTAPNSAF